MNQKPQAGVRVLLVDDSEVVRMGLRALLETEPAIKIVGEADGVASAVAACERQRPDVVLLDLRLRDGTGLDVCRRIAQRQPETRILVLTSVDADATVDEAIRAGVHGYLLKEINGRGLVQAILDVAVGKSILDPSVTARVLQRMKSGNETRDVLASLSPQEQRVLALIAEGKTNKEVGADLNLSEKTVRNYLSNIFDKLQVTRRAQAAALFVRQQSNA